MAEALQAAPPLEARLPCPVCIGVQMEKVALRDATRSLVLDHCGRCGGVWFDKGEPARLTFHKPSELWKHIPPRSHIIHPPCHGCQTPLDRNAYNCGVCQRTNAVSCPVCDRATTRALYDDVTLDVCDKCKGVWFDHAELRRLWSLKLAYMSQSRRRSGAADTGDLLLESLMWSPDLVVYGGQGIVSVAGHAADVLANSGGIIEVVGNAGEAVFEALVSIIAGILEGIGS